ncbi:uncharacterized protein LOC116303827 [Actinia tenebrosa]|uniref:Uncharacterized protein LOC116303827 n=1 Tax=Actinia tenebrosa TaxID=6105 RepID=A0A6P8IQW3_ACTTE|nr:uncharacterized protein LOC116303827 [Actinia tenebrosa]
MKECEEAFEQEVKDKVLLNHVFRLVEAFSPDLCLIMCNFYIYCISYNFGPSVDMPGWTLCELNDADRYIFPNDFKDKKGFSYRERKNPCLKNGPCKGNKTCARLQCDLKQFTCICPKGYFGENCEKDIDECATSNLHNCTLENPGVKCNNTPGSFKCICAEGYAGDGINCKKMVSWIKINVDPVCVGKPNDGYGTVIVPFDVKVKQLKLAHLSGAVSQINSPVTARNWGDNKFPNALYVVITDEKNKQIAPYPSYSGNSEFFFTIDSITVSSPELIYPIFNPSLPLQKNETLRVWFTEQLQGYMDVGSYGKACADMYIKL